MLDKLKKKKLLESLQGKKDLSEVELSLSKKEVDEDYLKEDDVLGPTSVKEIEEEEELKKKKKYE